MMPSSPAWLGISGIIVAIIAMSKSFLGTYFGVIEGATEIVKSSLNQVGVKKSRAFNRAISIMGVSLITFAVCCINPNAISMIYAISGPLIAMILFYHADAVDVSDPLAETVPLHWQPADADRRRAVRVGDVCRLNALHARRSAGHASQSRPADSSGKGLSCTTVFMTSVERRCCTPGMAESFSS